MRGLFLGSYPLPSPRKGSKHLCGFSGQGRLMFLELRSSCEDGGFPAPRRVSYPFMGLGGGLERHLQLGANLLFASNLISRTKTVQLLKVVSYGCLWPCCKNWAIYGFLPSSPPSPPIIQPLLKPHCILGHLTSCNFTLLGAEHD